MRYYFLSCKWTLLLRSVSVLLKLALVWRATYRGIFLVNFSLRFQQMEKEERVFSKVFVLHFHEIWPDWSKGKINFCWSSDKIIFQLWDNNCCLSTFLKYNLCKHFLNLVSKHSSICRAQTGSAFLFVLTTRCTGFKCHDHKTIRLEWQLTTPNLEIQFSNLIFHIINVVTVFL